MSVANTRKLATEGAIKAIIELIDKNAKKGCNSLDLSNYEGLYITDEVIDGLREEGYKVQSGVVYW